MVEYIIAKGYHIIGCHNTWILMIFSMMEQMKKSMDTIFELLLMVIR